MIQPRQYQTNAKQAIFNYFTSKQGNPVVAMPTASGKSVVIGDFVRDVLMQWPNQRIAVVTHVKELIKQNYEKLVGDTKNGIEGIWPQAPAGVFSAGLDKRDTAHPIIFGGVKSMVNCISKFGHRDLLLVDEAHLISGKEDSEYGELILGLKAINPYLKVIGFSATPWRMGNGHIADGPIFTDICYDLTTMESFNQLIAEGFLSLLVPKRTQTELHYEDVGKSNGDYIQKDLQAAVDKQAITYAACKEIAEQGFDRKSWLIFSSGIEHAEHTAEAICSLGIDAVAVHSKMDRDRDRILRDFKDGSLRCVVNNNVLTTGFDHPGIDLIGDLRPTASVVLHVQKYGRGLRPSPGTLKENCLCLDFARNTERLGPINDPVIPKKKGHKEGTAPVRICDECGTYNHARATECIFCHAPFSFAPKITASSAGHEIIRTGASDAPNIQAFNVDRVIYNRYQKNGSLPMIKVQYICGLQMHSEMVCIEHTGSARGMAEKWWKQRLYIPAPMKVDDALAYIATLKVPRQILVDMNRKYPQIMKAIF